MNLILTALKKNTDSEQGAKELDKAISEDHDGSLLDQIDTYLNGEKPEGVSDSTVNGSGILKHLFGQKEEKATDLLSKKTGVDKNTVTNILIQLAPIALALLGKAKNSASNDTQDTSSSSGIGSIITNLIGSAVSKQKTTAQFDSNPIMDIAEKFLDKNNDGSIVDDLLGMAMDKFSK